MEEQVPQTKEEFGVLREGKRIMLDNSDKEAYYHHMQCLSFLNEWRRLYQFWVGRPCAATTQVCTGNGGTGQVTTVTVLAAVTYIHAHDAKEISVHATWSGPFLHH